MHKHNIDLSDKQKIKLKVAFKKRKDAIIDLSREQLSNGKNVVLLTEEQHKLVTRAKSKNKGVRLTISYDKLLANKNGGLLNEILEFLEDNIPFAKKVTPLIRNTAALAIKE